MTEIELANWEEELQAHSREILERERALMEKERQSDTFSDINRTDYLFDKINRSKGKLTIETPVIQITPSECHHDVLTPVLAAIAAVSSVLALVAVLVV